MRHQYSPMGVFSDNKVLLAHLAPELNIVKELMKLKILLHIKITTCNNFTIIVSRLSLYYNLFSTIWMEKN